MSQLSLFSADLTPPQLVDLGGLLAAHGQIAAGPDGVAAVDPAGRAWRAEALLRECRVRDVPSEIAEPDSTRSPPDPLAALPCCCGRTATRLLAALAADWTRGAVKSVPAELAVTPGFLRCWTLAAGRPADIGFCSDWTRTPPTPTSRWPRPAPRPGWPVRCWVFAAAARRCVSSGIVAAHGWPR